MIIAIFILVIIGFIVTAKLLQNTNNKLNRVKSLTEAVGKTQIMILEKEPTATVVHSSQPPAKIKAPKVDLTPVIERIDDLAAGQSNIVSAIDALVDQLLSGPVGASYIGDDDDELD